MKTTIYFKFLLIIICFFLCSGCDLFKYSFNPNDIIINISPAHLRITNIDTGETAEKTSTITIGGDKVDLIVSRSHTLEIEFIPDSDDIDTDSDYAVDFELFDVKMTVKQSPYKIQYTINYDVPTGTYPICCSATNSNRTDSILCKQTMYIRILQ